MGRIKRQPSKGYFGERKLSPRDEEIYQSGAHTRDFDHREKNNIYDGKVSVRHTFIDWGQRSNRTEARTLALSAARIDAIGVMRERSYEMLRLALLLRRTAGMPLQVDILGGKRTIMNYIMTPIQKSLATAFREK